ncbi:hypothetical protein AX15_005440 [Amanita polypyramis BW_CC]|nr:hypothetical protein AX15_005440 [Amanita polypyramis BW_CC]
MRISKSLLVSIVSAAFCCADLRSDLTTAGITAVFPGDSNFAGDSEAYNERFTLQPVAVTLPTSAQQVSQIVQITVPYNYSIVARSGGHSYIANGLGGQSGALVIDLQNLKQISVSPDGTATIQTGNRLGNVAEGLNNNGRALPHGTCPYVGIGGHSAFGGWGFTSRKWGLTLDTIQSIDIVLANGTTATVSAQQYDDLFWAMRGAAPSFGITTAITVQTFPAPDSTTIFQYTWNMQPSEAANAVLAFQQFAETNVPPEFGSEFVIGRGNAGGELNFGLTGGWYGPSDQFEAVIAPFLAQVRQPDSQKLTVGTYIDSVQYLGGLGTLDTSAPDGRDTFYAKSLMTPEASPISDTALTAFMNYMANEGSQTDLNWFVEMEFVGGQNSAVNAVAANATAFGHRNSLWTFQLYASSPSFQPPYPSDGFTFLDDMVNSLTSNSPSDWDIGAYANYADDMLTNWQTLYYGFNYPQLQVVKRTYDPNNTFAFTQSVQIA